MAELVSYTLEDKVAVLQMDDGKANALSKAMIDALTAALARAEQEATRSYSPAGRSGSAPALTCA